MTSFLSACKENDLDKVKKIYFNATENLFAIDKNGDTAIHIAIKNKNKHLLETLLKWDLMIDINNKDKKNPYQLVLDSESNEILDIFLNYNPIEGFCTYFNQVDVEDYVQNEIFLSYLKEKYLSKVEEVLYEDDEYITILKNDGPLAIELLLPSIHDSDSLLSLLEYSIQSEFFGLSKMLIITLYKRDHSALKQNTDNIIKNIIIKENIDLFDFFIDLIELENINPKIVSDCISLYATYNFFTYFIGKYINKKDEVNIKRMLVGAIVRNSILMTDFLLNEFNVSLPQNALDYSMQIECSVEYLNYLNDKNITLNSSNSKLIIEKFNEERKEESLINLVKYYTDILDFTNEHNENLMHLAVRFDNFKLTEYLLSTKISANKISDFGLSPLLMISDKEDKWLDLFIKYRDKINFDFFDNNVNTLLNILVQQEDHNKIIKVIPYIKHINLVNINGFNPLLMAINKGNIGILKTLISNKADINCLFNNASSALDFALFLNKDEIAKYLTENGAISYDVMRITPITEAILEESVLSKDIEKIGYILSSYTKDSVKYNNNALPNKTKDLNILRILVLFGFDINGIGLEYQTPLMNAIIENNNETIDYLIDNGAFINNYCEVNGEVHNCLSLAIKNENFYAIKKLLKAKIDINFKKLKIENDDIFHLIKSSLPIRKIKKLIIKKTKVTEKVSLFKSIEKEKYVIEKDDSLYISDIKKILNILDNSSDISSFIDLINKEEFKISFMLENQSFEDIKIESKYNILTLEDLSLTISDFKTKIGYDYFKDFKVMINYVNITSNNTSKDLDFFMLVKNKEKLTTIYTMNNKKVGCVYENKRIGSINALLPSF